VCINKERKERARASARERECAQERVRERERAKVRERGRKRGRKRKRESGRARDLASTRAKVHARASECEQRERAREREARERASERERGRESKVTSEQTHFETWVHSKTTCAFVPGTLRASWTTLSIIPRSFHGALRQAKGFGRKDIKLIVVTNISISMQNRE